MAEYVALLSWKDMDIDGTSLRMDRRRAKGLEEHLRNIGAI